MKPIILDLNKQRCAWKGCYRSPDVIKFMCMNYYQVPLCLSHFGDVKYAVSGQEFHFISAKVKRPLPDLIWDY